MLREICQGGSEFWLRRFRDFFVFRTDLVYPKRVKC